MLAAVIEAQRVSLRPFSHADVDDVLAYASDPEWSLFSAQRRGAYARADAVAFVAAQMALDPSEKLSFALVHEGRVCGSIKLSWFFEQRVAELGFGIARRLWGQGLVVEACRALIGASFEAYPQLVRFRARCDAHNTRSLRVMGKLGMTREAFLRSDRVVQGELVDDVIYGLLRREWTR